MAKDCETAVLTACLAKQRHNTQVWVQSVIQQKTLDTE